MHRARPARQIPARRSVVGRGAADASRHVGLVPRAQTAAMTTPGGYHHERGEARRARPHRVPHVEWRGDHLQRSAPLRIDEAGRARQARRGASAARARAGAARQRVRRRHAGAGLPRQEDVAEGGAVDQRVVAGLGNIYVCEALHRARLSPKRVPPPSRHAPARRTTMQHGWSTASASCSTTRSRPAARHCATIA